MEAKGTATDLQIARLPQRPPSAQSIDGRRRRDLRAVGHPDAPVGDARATVAGATYEGQALPDLALVARADGRRFELTGSSTVSAAGEPPVAADDARRESVFLRGGGSFEGDWPVHLEIDVAALPTQALLEVFPATRGVAVEARGTFAVDVAARDPQKLRYTGRDLAVNGKLRELEWTTDPFRVEGNREEATVAGLRLSTRTTARVADPSRREDAKAAGGEVTPVPAGGTPVGRGASPDRGGPHVRPRHQGQSRPRRAAGDRPGSDRAAGVATLDARVRGTLDAPEAQGTFGVTDARGRFGGVRVNEVVVKGRLQGQEAFVDEASARVLGGRVVASGSLPIARLAGGTRVTAPLRGARTSTSRAWPSRTPAGRPTRPPSSSR